ncbi:GbsR/MarR family transcriptional regulator [Cellulomonas sp. NS3]|uniref:GbsR/MarR family transcriptional regulator n=1 Tax=Cellulomonas sp. NS3 TaxID=2973977 RepID=UPI0021613342|nr:MarR family transcriptional regulator [Cellulomonas sp. NS3]
MPGGRLTQQERQQIALGVSGDLPYAEIARRLGRPTSTITREVLRNGGPTAYRADLAHRATERRARQRRQVPPGRSRTPAQAHGRDAAAVREYEETFTTLFMQSGLPRIAAGVLTCLYTTDAGSLTAAQLVERVHVSPASVSKAIALLESQGLVVRQRAEGRRERYVADGDVWYQAMIAAARSNAQIADTARQGVRLLGRDTPAGVRLENMARFMDFVGERIAHAAEQARDLLSAGAAPPADADPLGAGNPEPSPPGDAATAR